MKKYSVILLFCIPLLSFGANTHTASFSEGSSQSLTAVDSTTIRVDDGWTTAFWYKQTNNPVGSQDKILFQRSGENGFGVAITTDGYIRLFAGSGAFSNADSNIDHSDGNWHHIRVYWNGASTKLYVDNALEATLNVPNITPPNATLEIGRGEASAFFEGQMDDIRIYPSEWTGTNYNCKLTAETGLNAHWNLDNSLLDATVNANNLTNNNSVTFQSTSLPYTADCGSGGGSTGSATTTTFSQDTYWDLLLLSEFVTVFLGSFYLVFKILWK